MKHQVVSEELLELMAEKFRALGDPTRLSILYALLKADEMNVGQLVEATGRSVANVSKHLKQLAEAGNLSRRKEGSFVLYKVVDPIVQKMCDLVCDSLHREFEVLLKRRKRLQLGKRKK